MKKKFWMIKVENGGNPNQAYIDHEYAVRRAEALARGCKSRVYLLEAVECVEPDLPEEKEIPVRWSHV